MIKSRKLLFISIFYIICSIFSTSVTAQTTKMTYSIADTYTAAAHDTTNYGFETSFKLGYWDGQLTQVYFKFDISEILKEKNDIQQALFIFEINSLNGSVPVEIAHHIDNNWDEYTLTWLNAPAITQFNLGSQTIDSPQSYSIEIQNGLPYQLLEDSLTLYIYKSGGGNFRSIGYTRETAQTDKAPRIVWEIIEEFQFPWHIVLPIIAIVAVSAGSVVLVRRRRTTKGRGSKDDISLRIYDGEPVLAGRYDSIKKAGGSIQESVCLFCGLRNRSRTGYCKGCGNPLSS
jgi:hypothetical protein